MDYLGLFLGEIINNYGSVLMQSSKGTKNTLSLVMLTRIFSFWKTNPYLRMTSLTSSEMRVRNAKSLVASHLVSLIKSCCFLS